MANIRRQNYFNEKPQIKQLKSTAESQQLPSKLLQHGDEIGNKVKNWAYKSVESAFKKVKRLVTKKEPEDLSWFAHMI